MSTELVAWVAFLLTLALLGVAMGCNATLVADNRRLRANALDSDRKAKAAKQETARYTHANGAMRAQVTDYADRIAEYEARETALKIILRANGIKVIDPDQPLPLLDEAELVAAEADPEFSPADIQWGNE